MPLRLLQTEDREQVRSLILGNPFKSDQIRAQRLDVVKLAEFHTERLFQRIASTDSPVYVFESRGKIGVLGFSPATYHSVFFEKFVISIDPVITYPLGEREKEAAIQELVPFLEPRAPEIVWVRCDEAEGDLVATWARFGGEYCGTSVRLSRWIEGSEFPERTGSVSLREATLEDLPELRRLARESHDHSHFFRDPYLPRNKKDEIFPDYMERCVGNESRPCWVTEDSSGKLLGFSLLLCPAGQAESIGRKVGIVDFIAVSPMAQGKGIGTALMEHSLRLLSQRGYECVELKTMLDNRQAIGFYQRHGFVLVSADLHFSIGKGGVEGWL